MMEVLAEYATEGAGWIIVNSESNRVSDIIEAGRRFQRMALLAREHKVGIHPISQYLEEAEGLEKITANHDPDVIPQFVLRVGYVDTFPEPLTLRRPVSWFVEAATL